MKERRVEKETKGNLVVRSERGKRERDEKGIKHMPH